MTDARQTIRLSAIPPSRPIPDRSDIQTRCFGGGFELGLLLAEVIRRVRIGRDENREPSPGQGTMLSRRKKETRPAWRRLMTNVYLDALKRQTARLINAPLPFHEILFTAAVISASSPTSVSRPYRGNTANLEVSWSVKRGRVFKGPESINGRLQMNVEMDIGSVPFIYIYVTRT